MSVRFVLFLAFLSLPGLALAADEETKDPPPAVTTPPPPPKPVFSAMVQERVRVEFVPNKDFADDPDGKMKVGNRVRAGLGMGLGPVKVFAQVQDVRAWGSEVNAANGGEGTLFDFNADNFDLHQGYGEVRSPYGLWFRLGRQEINWHGQRLIGAVGWADQGRSFDAARIVFEHEKVQAEVFYALLLDRAADPNDADVVHQDQHVIAIRGGPRLGDPLSLDGLAIIRVDNFADELLATIGAHAQGKLNIFSYEAEGYYQAGTRGDGAISAFLIGVHAGATLVQDAGLYVGGGIDVVSGDDNAADLSIGTFDTLYGTNHKFYGHFDRYLNLPVHTAGQGLVDGLFRVRVAPKGKVIVSNDIHFFGSMAPPDGVEGFHGVEWDLDATFKILPGFTVAAGVWTYFPGAWDGDDATAEVGAYGMTNFILK